MRITIIGGGKIGYTIAENLADENHDITVIDINDDVIERISSELDVLCVKGNGAYAETLRAAGVDHTDVLIAATGKDELNMIACLAAKNLGAKYTIARIRDYDYANEMKLITEELKIDLVINPESSTAHQISRLIRFPSAADIETFYHGDIELVGFRALESDFFVGQTLASVRSRRSVKSILFCSVEHKGETVIPHGSTQIQPGDRVFVIGNTFAISEFFRDLGRSFEAAKNVMIIGGGRIAKYLASILTSLDIKIKIIEQDYDTCVSLSELFPKAVIISGDGTDQSLLELENISECDCFLTLTGRDEDNILAALYAKQKGASKVIAKVDIDSVVSPKQTAAYSIIRTVRGIVSSHGSQMQALYKIAGGEAEAMEFIVGSNTKYLNIPLKDLHIKPNILLALIIRNGNPIIPEGNDFISAGDNIIIISRGHQIHDINDIYSN